MARLRRLAAVKGSGLTPGRLMQALAKGPLFGSEISRMPPLHMQRLRREQARRQGLGGRRSRLGLVWALGRTGQDPLGQQAWMGLGRYHKEWYQWHSPNRPDDAVPPDVLARGHRAAQRAPRSSGGTPIKIAVMAAAEAGWRWKSPAMIITRAGCEFDLQVVLRGFLGGFSFGTIRKNRDSRHGGPHGRARRILQTGISK